MAETNSSNVYIGGVYQRETEKYILISFNPENNISQLIPFNDNIVIGAAIENINEKHLCNCVDYWDMGQSDPDCNICNGKGVYYLSPKILFSDFTLVARTMRQFLIQKFVD